MTQKIELTNLEEYLKEIGKFPLLEEKEAKKLQKEINIIEENKQKLFNSNLRLVVSVAKKLLSYGISIEDSIKIGNEELEKAINNFNSFAENKPDLTTSTYYAWRIRFGIIREIINRNFPILTASIKRSLKENDFDGYYTFFFLEHILINLIIDKENGSEDATEILENSLASTFSDPELKNRISYKNFVREIPEFMEIIKKANPDIYKNLI
jgi:hypothetical protein